MKRLKLTLYFCLLINIDLSFAQSCNPNTIADAPTSRYIMNANGTALDKKTGLTWMRCALGQTWKNAGCTGFAQNYTWQGALQAAEDNVFAGLNDWRLPNQKELQSLAEYHCYSPAINLKAFPNATSGWYWSSSPYATMIDHAWVVNFLSGNDDNDNKSNGLAVRLVRGKP